MLFHLYYVYNMKNKVKKHKTIHYFSELKTYSAIISVARFLNEWLSVL